MTTTELPTSLNGMQRVLAQATGNASPVVPENDGTLLRSLLAHGRQLLSSLREALAATTDPRLALELATAARELQNEATRMSLTAADRLAATNAHLLDPAEYEQLRTTPADTTRPARQCKGRASFKNTAELLAAWLRIPYSQANKMVLDAADLIARRDPSGNQLPPRFSHLGQLFNDPGQDPQQVRETSGKLSRHEPKDTSFEGASSAPTLTHEDGRSIEEHAAEVLRRGHTPRETDQLVRTLIGRAAANPQNSSPAALRRGLFRLPTNNPLVREYLLRVSILEAERLESAIAQANNPRTNAGQAARSTEREVGEQQANAGADDRPDFLPDDVDDSARWEPAAPGLEPTPPERALNAIMDLLTSSPTGTGQRKTIRPEAVVYLQLQDLRDLASAHAQTAHGLDLPPGELRRLLCQANIISAVLGAKSELLDYGRTQRLVPLSLQRAVLARDRCCLVPGCTAPPSQLQFHHIKPWYLGGKTELANIGPFCDSDHHAVDSGQIEVVVIDGLPYVIMPKHIDPEQKPQRNTYWNPNP